MLKILSTYFKIIRKIHHLLCYSVTPTAATTLLFKNGKVFKPLFKLLIYFIGLFCVGCICRIQTTEPSAPQQLSKLYLCQNPLRYYWKPKSKQISDKGKHEKMFSLKTEVQANKYLREARRMQIWIATARAINIFYTFVNCIVLYTIEFIFRIDNIIVLIV